MNFTVAERAGKTALADGERQLRHVFVRNYVLDCHIGIHEHEKLGPQPVRFNLDLAVSEDGPEPGEDIRNVTCYEGLATGLREIVAQGHVNLVETLAETVATMCLQDSRVRSVRVRIEKLDALVGAESVGVEIERLNYEV